VSLLVGMEHWPWQEELVTSRADQGERSRVTLLAAVEQVVPAGGLEQLGPVEDRTESWLA
jgi:hypothetical protein